MTDRPKVVPSPANTAPPFSRLAREAAHLQNAWDRRIAASYPAGTVITAVHAAALLFEATDGHLFWGYRDPYRWPHAVLYGFWSHPRLARMILLLSMKPWEPIRVDRIAGQPLSSALKPENIGDDRWIHPNDCVTIDLTLPRFFGPKADPTSLFPCVAIHYNPETAGRSGTTSRRGCPCPVFRRILAPLITCGAGIPGVGSSISRLAPMSGRPRTTDS